MAKNTNELLSEEKEAKIREEIYEIDVRLQELDAIFEQYEEALFEREEEILSEEEVEESSAEYRKLKKKKKELAKSLKKSKWDIIPLWMVIYFVLQFIFSFTLIQVKLSVFFALWLGEIIYNVWDTGAWLIYTLLFLIPFLCLVASSIIFLFLKDKNKKKIFGIFFLIHSLEVIITVVIMLVRIL